ncbi:hypothetical protein DFP91_4237 [Pseudorhodoplanes sinuspersici]|nr:hypothetical protein DFP91_4237 [Pseudorhodoplanes sinuspersici]
MSMNDPRASTTESRGSSAHPRAQGSDSLTRFFGGSPLGVLGRLVLLSILIGFVMHAFGLNPFNIIESIRHLIETIWNLGFDALNWLWRYFLLGAVIVIPVWLIMRLVNAPRGK